MRSRFDPQKSLELRLNPKRAIGFEEAQTLFERPYYLDQRSDLPEHTAQSAGSADDSPP